MQPQGTRVMLSIFDFNGTSGRVVCVVAVRLLAGHQASQLLCWSCAASYYFITSHTAEYPMWGGRRWSIWVNRARSDQDCIRAAGGASSLIRNAGVNAILPGILNQD
eukprot:1159813-Pelagomonas_calceolata.AAC.17